MNWKITVAKNRKYLTKVKVLCYIPSLTLNCDSKNKQSVSTENYLNYERHAFILSAASQQRITCYIIIELYKNK